MPRGNGGNTGTKFEAWARLDPGTRGSVRGDPEGRFDAECSSCCVRSADETEGYPHMSENAVIVDCIPDRVTGRNNR